MEFDKNTSVSDEQRRLAETKKLTLEPVHGDITPEDISDSQIAAQHLINPAIENAPNDREQSERMVMPSKSVSAPAPQAARAATPSSAKTIAGVVILLCAAVTAGILFMTQK